MSENSLCDVFISYSSADVERAVRLEEVLSARGLKVWRDKSELRSGGHVEFSIPKALKQSAAVAVLWSEDSIKSDWVKHEASYAVVEGKALTLSIAPFEPMTLPVLFRGLNCGDLDATFADPSQLVERYEEIRASPGVHSRIDLSKLPETFAKKLYGREAEMARLIAAWDGGATRIFAFDAMGGAGKTVLVRHFVQALKAAGWRGACSVFAWSFYGQGSNEDRQTGADDFFRAAFKHFGGQDAAPPRDPREKGVELAHLVRAQRSLLILDGLEPLQYAARGGGHSSTMVGGVKDPGVKALLALLADHNPGLCLVTTRIQLAELRGAEGVVFEPLDRLPLMAGIELLRDLGVEPGAPPSLCCLPPRDAFDMLVPAYEPPADYAPPRSNPGATDESVDRQQARLGELELLKTPNAQANSAPDGPRDKSQPCDDGIAPAGALPAMPARIAKDIIEAVEELKGHALALTLIGKSLAEDYRGDIRAMHDLPGLPNLHPDDPARDPYRVMRGIEIALARRVAENKASARPAECAAGRQLAILFFLGLFDRPADMALLPVVFPDEAADYLQPEPDDLALAAKDLIQIERSLHELKEEREACVSDWRREEIAQEEAPLIAERDEAIEAARRVLVRRAFAGMAEAARDRWPIAEALRELARRGLIAKFDGSIDLERASVDCHPLVREYFGARLRELDRDSFKAMHWRLYDFYRYAGLPEGFRNPVAYGLLCVKASYPNLPTESAVHGVLSGELQPGNAPQVPLTIFKASEDDLRKGTTLIGGDELSKALAAFLPEDEAGMTPLFAAIAHGCAAEWEDETFNEVFIPRVSRGGEAFGVRKLGFYGQSLAALASFFETPFEKLSPRLSPARASLALKIADFQLRAIGRLEDAASPMRARIEASKAQGDWNAAAQDAIDLSELLLTVGLISGEQGALAAGEEAVDFGDRSAGMSMTARTARANALLQSGGLVRAELLLRDAEKGKPHLTPLGNFKYCALLLARGRTSEAAARTAAAIDAAKRSNWLLDIALGALMQARTAMASIAIATPAPKECAVASGEALAALRRANTDHYLLFGLLAHAEALWRCGNLEAANEPLREAETIAARGPMPLFMTDTHLLRARMALSQGDLAAAKHNRDAALDLIAKHAYGRAAPELALATAEIACAENSGSREAAIAVAIAAIRGKPQYDERTGASIDGGWWGLLPRLELLLPGDDPRRGELRAARDAYNVERDAYLAAEDARGWEEEDCALADPDFRRTLDDALVASGEKPLDDSNLAERRAVARQVLNQMREAQQQEEAPKPPEITDALVQHIFADPQAQGLLREVMQRNDLSGEPADLPLEVRRAMIAALVEAGVITLGEAPPQVEAPPTQAEKKKRGWWPF